MFAESCNWIKYSDVQPGTRLNHWCTLSCAGGASLSQWNGKPHLVGLDITLDLHAAALSPGNRKED